MTVTPLPPTAEHHRVPLGIGESRPRLSWRTTGSGPWTQAGYEVEVTRGGTCSVARVPSPDQLLVPWPVEPLRSREQASVRGRVFDASGHHSGWSGPTVIEAGLLRPGDWYRGRLGWRGGFRNLFGTDLSLIAQLEVFFVDGRSEVIATDSSWHAAQGPILHAGNYDGEAYDARRELPGWSSPGFDDAGWSRVQVRHRDPATLAAPMGPQVRCTGEVQPVAVLTTPSGRRVVDFGQNLVGRLRMRVSGSAGQTVDPARDRDRSWPNR